MKRKKMYELEIDKIQNIRMTLETQSIQLESAIHNKITLGAMSEGSKVMSGIQAVTGIEQVDSMLDRMKEESDILVEITGALSQSIDLTSTDDDELLAELYALNASDIGAELMQPADGQADLSLPTVPAEKLPSRPALSTENLGTKELVTG
jgi:charged multivesicular body protein 4A/B